MTGTPEAVARCKAPTGRFLEPQLAVERAQGLRALQKKRRAASPRPFEPGVSSPLIAVWSAEHPVVVVVHQTMQRLANLPGEAGSV